MKLVAVIPAFNEAPVLADVVQRCSSEVDVTIVVDDASTDSTSKVAKESGAQVLRHPIQRGAGRATATGIRAALRLKADCIVTLDADGQHNPEEITSVVDPLRRGEADIVVGCRSLRREQMPLVRRLGNNFASLWTWAMLGALVSDSQSGFRAYTKDAASVLPLEARGYEFCSQTLGEAAKLGLRITEVPITVVYTEYSLSKGQSVLTAIRTLGKIAKEGFR